MKMNKINPEYLPNLADVSQWQECADKDAEALFDELQAIWDEHSQRIDQILAAHPVSLDVRYCQTSRRRLMVQYLLLAIVNVAAAICALATLIGDSYYLLRITGIVLATTNALLAFRCIADFVSLRSNHPERVSILRMSRFIRRRHMEYVPRTDNGAVVRHDFRNVVGNAFASAVSSARQVAAVSAAALVILTSVSCFPVGDGYAMTKADRASRALAIENVNAIIAQL